VTQIAAIELHASRRIDRIVHLQRLRVSCPARLTVAFDEVIAGTPVDAAWVSANALPPKRTAQDARIDNILRNGMFMPHVQNNQGMSLSKAARTANRVIES